MKIRICYFRGGDDEKPPVEVEGDLLFVRSGQFNDYTGIRKANGRLLLVRDQRIYDMELLEDTPSWLTHDFGEPEIVNSILLHEKMQAQQNEVGLTEKERWTNDNNNDN